MGKSKHTLNLMMTMTAHESRWIDADKTYLWDFSQETIIVCFLIKEHLVGNLFTHLSLWPLLLIHKKGDNRVGGEELLVYMDKERMMMMRLTIKRGLICLSSYIEEFWLTNLLLALTTSHGGGELLLFCLLLYLRWLYKNNRREKAKTIRPLSTPPKVLHKSLCPHSCVLTMANYYI